jgi:predicted MFS family arabinose efflux permease
MSAPTLAVEAAPHLRMRTRLLRTIVAAIFLLFFQTYMVAPLIPSLANALRIDRQRVGLLIPAYTIPYAVAALLCGAIADRFGRRRLLFFSLGSFPIVGLALASAPTFRWLIALRIVSGITNVGVVVSGLSLIGDLFRNEERGHAIGWLFGAIAGGCAFGSTLGGLLTPLTGWRGLFALVAAAGCIVLIFALPLWQELVETATLAQRMTVATFMTGYGALFRTVRGARTYLFIFLNAAFHSGVFTWLGVLLHDRFGLGEAGIGLALLGYGVPGLILGPTIGKIVDRRGRRRLIPLGMLIAAATAATLAPNWPLAIAAIAITFLSLGFDMSHPLLAGIATTLDDRRRGQAMGMNTFSIFFGLGCGSLLFGRLAQSGMSHALIIFAIMQATLGLFAFVLFRSE